MDFGNIQRVAIIGAGVAGLGTAKTLLAAGLDAQVFDRAERLGGVWADGYVNFGVQVQKELYEFPDWPLPPDAPSFTPGPVFQRYLEGYADHFGIRPHLRLGTKVTALAPRPDGAPGWRLDIEGAEGSESPESKDFDLVVVATGLYSNRPNLPDVPGRDAFQGDVWHNSQIKTRDPLTGKRVVVVGYGKSASDAALEAAEVAESVQMVFRRVHWPVPRKLAGLLPFKWGMLNRMTAALIEPYVRPSPLVRQLHGIGKPLAWIYWRAVALLLRQQWGLGMKIAGGGNLVPDVAVEIDCFGESTMVPRPDFYRHIRAGRIGAHKTAIDRFEADAVVLASGQRLKTDCVVFATGWKSDYGFLGAAVLDKLGQEEDGFYLYRHMLHPDLPNLAFVGRASTFASVLTYSLQARWLAELLAGRVTLPGASEMAAEIAALKAWKRGWMPFSTSRGARVLLHMMHYHDELLTDFGANPLRKRGPLWPFKELFAPYQPSDFRDIVSGDWVETEGRRNS